ncbi:MAG: hypothetical protein AAGB48_03330 [Planctomycetota bacterium]
MPQWIQNINPQIVILFLAFGLPAVLKVIQWLQQQRAKAQAQAQRRRAIEEAMRTGRPVANDAPTSPELVSDQSDATEETFAERRRRQIEELRRREAAARQQRQRQQQQQQQTGPRPTPQRPVPARRQQRISIEPTVGPAPVPATAQQTQAEPLNTGTTIARDQISGTLAALTSGDRAGGGRLASATAAERSPTQSAPIIGALTREDWKRAIVLGEVLAPPRAVRGYGDPSSL